jgi:uncharacterized protein (DUF4415 family)
MKPSAAAIFASTASISPPFIGSNGIWRPVGSMIVKTMASCVKLRSALSATCRISWYSPSGATTMASRHGLSVFARPSDSNGGSMTDRTKHERGPRNWQEARRMARESADRMTDEEDAAIHAAALRDPDNPPLTEEQLAQLRPMAEVRPDLLRKVRKMRGQRGPQKSKPVKQRVSLRLDPDIVGHFKKRGPGWQSRLNAALRKALRLKAVSN